MSRYGNRFDDTAPDDSVVADKGALDPLAEPDEIVACDAQERDLASTVYDVHGDSLSTVSLDGARKGEVDAAWPP